MKLYSVHDKKARVYSRPFVAQSNVIALREFTAAVRNPDDNNNLRLWPEDFELIHIGEFNEDHGTVTPRDHQVITSARDVLESSNGK